MIFLYATAVGLVFVGLKRNAKEEKSKLRTYLWLIVVLLFILSFLMPIVYGFLEQLFTLNISNDVYALTSIILYVTSAISAIGLFFWGLISHDEKKP
jgi:nitrate reductase NapE component